MPMKFLVLGGVFRGRGGGQRPIMFTNSITMGQGFSD